MQAVFSGAIFCMFDILHGRLQHRGRGSADRYFARKVEVGVELVHFCDMRPSGNTSISHFHTKPSETGSLHMNHNSCTRRHEIYVDPQDPIAYSVVE
jgi:hypothetical protein